MTEGEGRENSIIVSYFPQRPFSSNFEPGDNPQHFFEALTFWVSQRLYLLWADVLWMEHGLVVCIDAHDV